MLGKKLKELRGVKGLMQRQIAADLQVDTHFSSKMEHDEKPARRTYLKKLYRLHSGTKNDLLPIGLAVKVLQFVEKKYHSVRALEMALNKVNKK